MGGCRRVIRQAKAFEATETKIEIDDDLAIGSEEARKLCFEVGEKLGFEHNACESLIAIIGNPIATLKFLVAAGNEGRKLAKLENSGLLRLPETPENVIIHSARQEERLGRAGVVVNRVGPRKPKKK
jgi:hypothetical protein